MEAVVAGRPALRKKGAFTRAEIQRRYRARQKRNNPDPQTRAKQEQRAARERDLAERTIAASRNLHTGGKLYGIVLADPPWQFAVRSRETGMDRAAENHYPTMNRDDIAALHVPAAPDCALFLWATIPLLPAALAVMTAWGFTYKSHMAWIKDKPGTGYWFRAQHELLLVGTRGKIPAPAPGQQWPSVIVAPRAAHSVKPSAVYQMIEQQWPNTPKLEMFARQARPGWDCWGNELDGAGGLLARMSGDPSITSPRSVYRNERPPPWPAGGQGTAGNDPFSRCTGLLRALRASAGAGRG